ncbi:uncharacterized protein METZ01_LOCUS372190, partial [marine metagenome]
MTNDPEMRKAFRRAAALDSMLRDQAQKQAAESVTIDVSQTSKWKPLLAVAAGLVLAIGTSFFILNRQSDSSHPVLAKMSRTVTIVKSDQRRVQATAPVALEPTDLVEVGPKG